MTEPVSDFKLGYEDADRILTAIEHSVEEIIASPGKYRPSEIATLINSHGANLTTIRLQVFPDLLKPQQASLARRVLPLLERMKAIQDLLVEPYRIMIDDRMSMVIDPEIPPS